MIGYAALKALRLLAAKPRCDPRRFIGRWDEILRAGGGPRPASGWLADLLRWIELCEDFAVIPSHQMRDRSRAALAPLRDEGGGYGSPGANLPDTAAMLEISARFSLDAPDSILAYARRCEAPPFGFNITPAGAGSNLATSLAGMRILRHYGVRPAYPDQVRFFVASCQTATGGFGRAPRAIAQLNETLRALEVLMLIAAA